MAEVYTISGPIEDLARRMGVTEKDKIAAMRAAFDTQAAARTGSTPSSIPAPPRLQNALRALGNLHGDPALTKIKVDGIIGPATVKGVNYAIAQKYVVMPNFPRPELTLQHVRQFSTGIAAAIEGAVTAGGGKFSPITAAMVHRPKPSGGGAVVPIDIAPTPTSVLDKRWVWWAVGGLGVLVILSVAAKAVRGRRGSSKRRARDDDED